MPPKIPKEKIQMPPKIPKNLRLHQRKKRTDSDTKHVLEGEVNAINAALRRDLSVLTAGADPEIALIRKGEDPEKVAAVAKERQEREALELEQRGAAITIANRKSRDNLTRNTKMVDDFLEPTTFYREPRTQFVGIRTTMFRIRCRMCDGMHFTSLKSLNQVHESGRIQTCACAKGREITRAMKKHMLPDYVLDGEPRTKQDKVTITCPNGHVERPNYNSFMKKIAAHPDEKFECNRCACGTDIVRTMKSHMLPAYTLEGKPYTKQDKVAITCPKGHTEHPSFNNFMKKISEHPDEKFECKRCAGTDKRFKEDD